jgi:hypothetical protein
VKSGEPVAPESFGPLADVPHAHAAGSGGLLQGLTRFEQEQDPAAARRPGMASRGARPSFELSAVFRGQGDGRGGVAARMAILAHQGECQKGEQAPAAMVGETGANCQSGTSTVRLSPKAVDPSLD